MFGPNACYLENLSREWTGNEAFTEYAILLSMQRFLWFMMSTLAPDILLDCRNITVLRGGRRALDGLTVTIGLGENTAIVGPNGSGKSTLIKTLMRECYPLDRDDASLKIFGKDRWRLFDLRPMLGIVSPDWIELCSREITGREAILSGFFSSTEIWPHNELTPLMCSRASEVLSLLEIEHLAERRTDQMSSGEVRRILIGRALVHDPKALILDEPMSALDLRAVRDLRKILSKIVRAGTMLVLVTHHLPDIIPEIGRIVLMKNGQVFHDGPKEEVLGSSSLSKLFGVPIEVIKRDGYYTAV